MTDQSHTLPGAPQAGDSPIHAPGGSDLLARLDAAAAGIAAVTANARTDQGLSSAAQPLLDHAYLIDEQVRFVRRHLPRTGEHQRIDQLALEALAHGDGRLEYAGLCRSIAACQADAPLALAELRAFPLVLRLALIEKLCGLAARLENTHRQRALARD